MKFGLALAVFFTAFTATAGDAKLSVTVKEGAGKVVSFTVADAKEVHVAIYSDENVIFNENLKGKGSDINRSYDLTAFPEGTYYLETETGTKVLRYQIIIGFNTATVSKAVNEVIKPVIVSANGVITLNILNTEKTPVAIKMYDEDSNELYAETVTGQEALAKKFDVKNATGKNITLVMSYNNKMFVETVAAR